MSTGTDFGTERSGTEMSTGRVFEGTEVSTGTDFGTERSGTEMSTGRVFEGTAFGLLLSPTAQVVLSALADHASTLRRRGALEIALDQ
jgi:hypothetical protein